MPGPIPPRPKLEHLNPKDENFENDQFEQQRIMANYNLLVQAKFDELKQENEMKSNLLKKQDEAISGIIRNIRP
ncbi:MAG TPA: hypothetical protein VGB98_07520 [Pyrinomonadaceae bacterium]|jgi:hypothetical protein